MVSLYRIDGAYYSNVALWHTDILLEHVDAVQQYKIWQQIAVTENSMLIEIIEYNNILRI